jgi:hypothetical protein
MILSNLYYQIIDLNEPRDSSEETVIMIIYWILWLVILTGTILSKVKSRNDFVDYLIVITLVRNLIPMMDIGNNRLKFDHLKLWSFTFFQSITCAILLVAANFLINNRATKALISTITPILVVLGICIHNKEKNLPLAEFIDTQMTFVITTFINGIIGVCCVSKLLSFGEFEVLKACNEKKAIENDIELILSNLEEAIITKSDKD